QEQRRVRARRFPARGWPAARGNRGKRERGSRATFRWSWVERRWSVAAAPRRGADGGGSGRRRSCSGEGMRLRTGRRASGGRGTSVLWVGSCGGRQEMGVHRWEDLAGANGSSAIVLANFGGLGRRGMGQGAAIWGGGGRAQLGLENMGVEGVVP